jgi:dimeric dUTPase (all-alpha-NTP-PPase superfamily)
MNVHNLLNLQRELDARIKAEHHLQEHDLVSQKLLALQVELAELANETRCFKFWSRKPPSAKPVILEEYVDALHFVLSLALELGFTSVAPKPYATDGDLTASFLDLMTLSSRLADTRAEEDFQALFSALLSLGEQLGLTEAEIERAYLAKNEINHQRQEEGY